MSTESRGKIIRGAGTYLSRNNHLGVGMGFPTGGDEGDIRVQMVDGSPRLCAKAGNQWYCVGLEEGVADEFTIGSSKDHVKITPADGITIINDNTNVAALGTSLRVGLDSTTASALRVSSAGALTIGTSDTTNFSVSATGVLTTVG